MKISSCLVILLLSCSKGSAADFVTVGGQVYSNVTVKRAEPDSLVVMNSKGIVRIPFAELSPDVQQQYGYNPTNAAIYSAQKQQSQSKAAVELSKARKQRSEQNARENAEYEVQHAAEVAARRQTNAPAPVAVGEIETTGPVNIIIEAPKRKTTWGDVAQKQYDNEAKRDPVRRIGQ